MIFVRALDELIIPNIVEISDNNTSNVLNSTGKAKFNFKQVRLLEVDKVISGFPDKYSAGVDEITIIIIK